VLTIAREEGISMQELEYIPGTGGDNRVTKKDILNYVAKRSVNANGNGQSVTPAVPEPVATEPAARPVAERTAQPTTYREVPTPPVQQPRPEPPVQRQEPVRTAPQPPAVTEEQPPAYVPSTPSKPVSAPAISFGGRSEIVEMDRMRKMIAQRMVESKRTSPHVTSFVEADVTNIVYWRNRIKNEFKAREGDTITYTPVFIEAITKAIKDYPMINVSVDGDKIIVKKDINIGMAVALPSGNLIVPVIKGADQLNMVGLTRKVNDLARRARENKLTADDLTEGTYTMSNVGSFGNVMGTPIIVQPQVGIMAFGAIQKKPSVIETPFGDTLGIRHMMFLSHSYDHRVVDGALGGMFVRRVADYLEGFDVNRKVF
jgi:2-oxoglutarate dehydrogenase E2 component (dihydrolipoamide succinyltransferase)